MEIQFVLNQLRGLAAVDNKLKFIRSAAEKYELPEEAAARIFAECDLIETRMNDDRLKMAVVGEFSSGKSSFINALLREELLETDVLQGTTVLSVMIYYSDIREIIVIKSGKNERTVYENADEFRERIRQLNRDTDENTETRRLEIGLPSEFLKRGICIIDTPGILEILESIDFIDAPPAKKLSDLSVIGVSMLGAVVGAGVSSRVFHTGMLVSAASAILPAAALYPIMKKTQSEMYKFEEKRIIGQYMEQLDSVRGLILEVLDD